MTSPDNRAEPGDPAGANSEPAPGPAGEPGSGPGPATPRPAPDPAAIEPEQSPEDTDAAWGDYPDRTDDYLLRDRPPHWNDY
jgi:hypothetical protein